MTDAERAAWRFLLAMGATKLMVSDRHALSLTSVAIANREEFALFCRALVALRRCRVDREMVMTEETDDPGKPEG